MIKTFGLMLSWHALHIIIHLFFPKALYFCLLLFVWRNTFKSINFLIYQKTLQNTDLQKSKKVTHRNYFLYWLKLHI